MLHNDFVLLLSIPVPLANNAQLLADSGYGMGSQKADSPGSEYPLAGGFVPF
jgi:hypothetical protein